MKIGMPIAYAGGFAETAEQLVEFEGVGLDVAFVAEPYAFDAVSQLGFLAAKTRTLQLGTGIINIYSRTPTLVAMTAAGLDYVSGGRFVLGIGASGPQVVEGFHGVPFDAPLGRTREVVDICRQVWRREKVDFHGRFYDVPLTKEKGGSGLGKPLKLINHPVRSEIPIVLAALGPKNVELAAELCDGWEPIFYFPERAEAAFGEPLAAGRAKRSETLAPLDVVADTKVLISTDRDEVAAAEQQVRDNLALYIGGMGAKGKNFYNDLAGRYGFAEEAARVQDLYLAGDKAEAARSIPAELLHGVALVGDPEHVASRVAAFAAAGVTTLNATPLAATHEARLADVARLAEYAR
ncbi:LLM class F420-dependent oxidoreductase [Nocardioides zeae]|uniref:LLM class F420-dependent oxidoreductase n=1 Tax=Nocardioides zeae TaxID=1457234 RepID=A0A6P0HKJ1_9ACTN|nr:LLM class F420-dependent oxidoreductase [Nocardioides zeae]NEN79106.1 LLM class F420-dependent oxidoreductase [Nocardioides zeae]